jgi:hypothetical protein
VQIKKALDKGLEKQGYITRIYKVQKVPDRSLPKD